MRNRWRTVRVAAAAMALFLAGCATGGWSGEVRTWGTLREVLREGDKSAKVRLDDAVTSPGTIGIGALAGLEGEIVVVEGRAWTSRTDGERTRGVDGDSEAEAAFLAVADVPRWETYPIDRDLGPGELDGFLDELRGRAGLREVDAFPFLVEGELYDLEAHVLNGRCPYTDDPEGGEPFRASHERTPGLLVGIYAGDLAPGILTHHDSRSHVHVLLRDEPFVGHVDSARIGRGSTVRVPGRR